MVYFFLQYVLSFNPVNGFFLMMRVGVEGCQTSGGPVSAGFHTILYFRLENHDYVLNDLHWEESKARGTVALELERGILTDLSSTASQPHSNRCSLPLCTRSALGHGGTSGGSSCTCCQSGYPPQVLLRDEGNMSTFTSC